MSHHRWPCLVTPYRRTLLARKGEELHVYLHVMARNLFLVAVRVHSTSPDSVRKPGHAMPLADPIDRCIRSLDVVIALQIPNDPNRVHVIGPPQVQDLLNNLVGSLVRMVVGVALATREPGFAELAIPVSPEVER